MDTELLKTFLEVRNTRHFGRAAENLCITQAAVSARIKQLEESLGATLFVRGRNNIQLSSEGERLIPHAEAVLLSLARARQDVALQGAGGSQIYLGVRSGIWHAALQHRLYKLQESEADLLVRLESHTPDHLTRKLLDLTLDMALLYEPPGPPELESRPLGKLTLTLFSSVRRQSVAAALAQNYIYMDWGEGFARFHARSFGDQWTAVLRTNLPHLAIDYLVARGGSCFLPVSLKSSLAGSGLKPVAKAPAYTRQLHVACHVGNRQRDLIDRVTGYFTGLML
ncbi:MAG: LysR family transcriptional regulator [Halioglobus sp.]|nr:LysR family transcriptional regulator [Halioglobus sp.]